jgi:hypothetical protein
MTQNRMNALNRCGRVGPVMGLRTTRKHTLPREVLSAGPLLYRR